MGADLPGSTIIGSNTIIGHHAVVGVKCQDKKYKVGVLFFFSRACLTILNVRIINSFNYPLVQCIENTLSMIKTDFVLKDGNCNIGVPLLF